MKIGVVVPIAAGDGGGTALPSWQTVRSFARRAEALGFDSLWVADHLIPRLDALGGPGAIHEAWSLLTALAASTERIEVGSLVLAVPFRNPALLAKMAVTADEVSGGRLILGLGTGYREEEFAAFGYPPAADHPVARLEEALAIIVPLLDGKTADFEGRFHSAHGAVLLPPPARRIPILIAASGPRLLRVTARWAEAWNTAWYARPDDRLAATLAAFDAALAAEGRDRATIEVTVGMRIDRPDDETARAIAEFAAAGIDHLIVRVEPPRTERSLELLAEAVGSSARAAA